MHRKPVESVKRDFNKKSHHNSIERANVTLNMLRDYKDKYDILQRVSGREFGHVLRNVVAELIDEAYKNTTIS